MRRDTAISLHTGREMPVLGLGTWQLTADTAGTVARAVEIGYRMIDTSGDYGIQPGIGEALHQEGVAREVVHLVTKVEESARHIPARRRPARHVPCSKESPSRRSRQPAVGGITPRSAIRIEGDSVMDRIEKTVEIEAPVQAVYDQWARFEEFPDFVEEVQEVRWIDDTHLHWRARLAGEDVEWNAEIVEQTPFESIAWRGGAGMSASGRARFEPFDTESTRVTLTLELDPEAVPGHFGDAPDAVARQLGAVLDAFKRHIEAQDQAKHSGTPGAR